MYLINFIRGFCMALADSVPGVSGGTIAFILGFYDKFIGSLDDLITGKKAEKIEALKFLINLRWKRKYLPITTRQKHSQKLVSDVPRLLLGE